MSGILVSFDGVDSSGKETQATRLAEHLTSLGQTVHRFETPDYTTPSGIELKERLQGKRGDWTKTPWEQKMELFATNRTDHKQEVIDALKKGEVVIYDRYVPSSLAFMGVEARQENPDLVLKDIYHQVLITEYAKNRMPEEDMSIFLDMPPQKAIELLQDRKQQRGDQDEYTDQLKVQELLYDQYEHLCDNNPDRYIRIPCIEKDQLRSIDDIAQAVWQAVIKKHPELDE